MFKSKIKTKKPNKYGEAETIASTSNVSSSNALRNLPTPPPSTSFVTPQRPPTKLNNSIRSNKEKFDFGIDLDDLDWDTTLPSFETTNKLDLSEISKRSADISHDLSIAEADRSEANNCDLEDTFLKTIERSKKKAKLNLSDADKNSIVMELQGASNRDANNLEPREDLAALELNDSFCDDIWFENSSTLAAANNGDAKSPVSPSETASMFCNAFSNQPVMISAKSCETARRLFETMDCLLLGEIGCLVWNKQNKDRRN